jgi:16S rRNA U1498 N3-methylase RsmE
MTLEQQSKIREDHDVWVKAACNQCGRVLAEIRYTRKDEQGEWCSAICRDGAEASNHAQRRRNTRDRIRQARAGRISASSRTNVIAFT